MNEVLHYSLMVYVPNNSEHINQFTSVHKEEVITRFNEIEEQLPDGYTTEMVELWLPVVSNPNAN